MTSLNPVFSIGNQVMEAIQIYQNLPKKGLMASALDVLRKVNIPAAETRMRDYLHQMSGGGSSLTGQNEPQARNQGLPGTID